MNKVLQYLAEFVRFYELLAFPFGTKQFKTDSRKLKRQLARVCNSLSSAKMVHPKLNLWVYYVIMKERTETKSVFFFALERSPQLGFPGKQANKSNQTKPNQNKSNQTEPEQKNPKDNSKVNYKTI